MLFDWNKGWKRNTHKLGRKASCERWFGTSMCHQRSKILCGGQCPIFYWREITCIGEEWLWRVPASSTANTLKRKLTYCGSAPLPTMFGRWLEEECRNSATMREIFSSSDARETDTGGDEIVVHYNLGDMERKEQSQLSKCSVTTQSDIWRGPWVACYIPDPLGYSSNYVTRWYVCLFGVCSQGYGGVVPVSKLLSF